MAFVGVFLALQVGVGLAYGIDKFTTEFRVLSNWGERFTNVNFNDLVLTLKPVPGEGSDVVKAFRGTVNQEVVLGPDAIKNLSEIVLACAFTVDKYLMGPDRERVYMGTATGKIETVTLKSDLFRQPVKAKLLDESGKAVGEVTIVLTIDGSASITNIRIDTDFDGLDKLTYRTR